MRDMQFGWTGLSRAITLSIVLTSVFWIVFGIWLFHGRTNEGDHRGVGQAGAGSGSSQGLLGSLSGRDAPGDGKSRSVVTFPSARLASGLHMPVAGVAPDKLTDTFAQARAEGARHHDAIDIMAAEGTPVLAAAPGTVEKVFASQAGGNTIYVRSADRRMIFYYAHLAAYARSLREGGQVRAGQFLGTVGHTGNAAAQAPHLHFAMWIADPAKGWSQDAPAIDPFPYLSGKEPTAGRTDSAH